MRVPWETFGRARAALDAGTDSAEVLRSLALEASEWATEEERLLSELADEVERGEHRHALVYSEAYRATWVDLTGEVPFVRDEVEATSGAPSAVPSPAMAPVPPATAPKPSAAFLSSAPAFTPAIGLPAAAPTSAPPSVARASIPKATVFLSMPKPTAEAALPFAPSAAKAEPPPSVHRAAPLAPTANIGQTAWLPTGATPSGPALPFAVAERIPVERYAEITAILETEGDPEATFRKLGITTWNWLNTVQFYSGVFAKDPALAQRFEALKKKAMGHAR